MNTKKFILLAVVVVAIAGAVVYYYAAGGNDNTYTGSTSSNNSSDSSSSSESPATDKVVIENFAFSPASITVKKGTTVTWTNNDSMAHTVTETDGQTGPKSGNLSKGETYSFTFDTVGTYKYDCTIHPSMTGTVKVTE